MNLPVDVNENRCIFCGKKNSPYTCPRCNGHYCSAICYKHEKHINCSEDFYREWVRDYCKNEAHSSTTKEEIVSFLKKSLKQQEEEPHLDSDDDDMQTLEDRMAGIDFSKEVNASIIWERLSDAEKKTFTNKVKSGEAVEWIETWIPWWQTQEETRLVVEVPVIAESKTKNHRPTIKPGIPHLSALTSRPPAECIKNNVVNVLTSYVLTVKFYNGDHFEFPEESVKLILQLSDYLMESKNYSSAEEAFYSAFHKEIANAKHNALNPTSQEKLEALEDVIMLLNGPNEKRPLDYILAVVSDMLDLTSVTSLTGKKSRKSHCKRLTLMQKKLEYLLSWTVDNHTAITEATHNLIVEKASVAVNKISFESAKNNFQKQSDVGQDKTLITEL